MLAQSLNCLLPQCNNHTDQVEILISDNASTDETQHIVNEIGTRYTVRYERRSLNLGPVRNIMNMLETALGEYIWIVGDDDLIINGGIEQILKLLIEHPVYGLFVLNHEIRIIDDAWSEIASSCGQLYKRDRTMHICQRFDSGPLARFEDVMRYDGLFPPLLYGSLGTTIFRRRDWQAAIGSIHITEQDREFDSLKMTYPHLIVLSHAFMGQPVFYVGEAQFIKTQGPQQSWMQPNAHLLWGHYAYDAINLYSRLGMQAPLVRQLRQYTLDMNKLILPHILTNRLQNTGAIRFSLARFLWSNRMFPRQMLHFLYKIYVWKPINRFLQRRRKNRRPFS